MEKDPFRSLKGHEVLVEQVWGDGTRVFHRGWVESVEGTLVFLVNSDVSYDPSPAWAMVIAKREPLGDDADAQPDPRTPFADFPDLWVNLASIAVVGFVDITATRPNLARPRRESRPDSL